MASGTGDRPPLRLRIPAALAISLLGGTAIVAQSFVGCEEHTPPEPIDAGRIFNVRDAGIDGPPIDAGEPIPEASLDGGETDGGSPVDAMVDAYVRPDTPVG